jgi:hypothetical protein
VVAVALVMVEEMLTDPPTETVDGETVVLCVKLGVADAGVAVGAGAGVADLAVTANVAAESAQLCCVP